MLTRTRLFAARLACLLIVAAAGVRGAAPLVDGLLHHRGAAQEAAGIHLDRPGGCDSHAEHCAVRGHSSGLRYAGGARVARSRVTRSLRLASSLQAVAPSRGAISTHHSRAPPPTA